MTSVPSLSATEESTRLDPQPPTPSPTLDSVFENSVGIFGRWQLRLALLMSLLKFPIAWFQLGIVFLAPPTRFWCRRPPSFANTTLHDWLQLIHPGNGSQTNYREEKQHQSLVHGLCTMKDPSMTNGVQSPEVPCLWGYEFDTSEVHSSIITEWNLVCGKERLIDVAQAMTMFGILIGTLGLGIASDRWGRRPTLVTCIAVQAVAGSLIAFAPNYSTFLIARLITAMANGGTMVISFVICMEVVGGKWRTIVPILYQIPFGLGNSIMACIAYLVRDWRDLQLILSALSSLYLVYWKLIPESPRWLLATGRTAQAVRVLEQAAVENHLPVARIRSTILGLPSLKEESTLRGGGKQTPPITAFCRTPTLRKRTFFLCLQWLLTGISFYGFSQYMGQVSTHLYVMVALGGLVSVPGTFLCCAVIQRCGRRVTIAAAHIITAMCYLGILVVPGDWPRVALAAAGVIGMSVSIPALYLFTGEIFPTVMRNAGVGAAVTCSRLGSMLAPFVSSLSTVASWIPLFVLSTLVLIQASLVLPLPETKDTVLPDTASQAETFMGNKPAMVDDAQNGNYLMELQLETSVSRSS